VQPSVIVTFAFLAVLGACVGSFLNVVIWRLPMGESLVRPGSHCPKCQTSLKWYDNLPIFGWLFLRGKCRYCGTPISAQYPLIEMLAAFLLVILYYAYYFTTLNDSFEYLGPMATWPVYAVHVALLSGLLAATLIDARHYIIPVSIPWVLTLAAVVVLPVYAHYYPQVARAADPLVPVMGTTGVHLAAGGMIGLLVSLLLVKLKLLPRSFDDDEARALDAMPIADADDTQAAAAEADARETEATDDQQELPPVDQPEPQPSDAEGVSSVIDTNGEVATQTPDEQDDDETDPQRQMEMYLEYSHPRREVLKEAAFVAIPVVLAVLVLLYLDGQTITKTPYPESVRVLGGVLVGYLAGGGIVWLTRILGTLGFGREAMGLGDVHLLGAIGAVLGYQSTVIVFFIAPFLGLGYVLIAVGVSRVARGKVRVIPYGPYLALATLLLMLAHDPIMDLITRYFFPY
jgi:leader peptidase (prepilin peptidase)/N-methyltransferase